MINLEDGEWLVPFKGRNQAGAYNQNFLWRHNSLYVMDNHRAAAWCWLQHVNPTQPHSLLHMDWHADALRSQLDKWLEQCPDDLTTLSLQEYLALDYEVPDLGLGRGRCMVFRWDNYLSIYFARYGDQIKRLRMLTHNEGGRLEHKHCFGDIWDVPANIDFWLDPQDGPWILNIDIDYFFWHDSERPGLMVSDSYLERCFKPIRMKIDSGEIAVTTIALWDPTEHVAKKILRILGVNFVLAAI